MMRSSYYFSSSSTMDQAEPVLASHIHLSFPWAATGSVSLSLKFYYLLYHSFCVWFPVLKSKFRIHGSRDEQQEATSEVRLVHNAQRPLQQPCGPVRNFENWLTRQASGLPGLEVVRRAGNLLTEKHVTNQPHLRIMGLSDNAICRKF